MEDNEDRASSGSENDTIEDLDEIQLRIKLRNLERRIRKLEMMFLDKTSVLTPKGLKHYAIKTFLKQLPLIVGVAFIIYAFKLH